MKTSLECIPCFFRQLLESSRLVGAGVARQKQVIDAFARQIPTLPLQACPPEIARVTYQLLRTAGQDTDPYRQIKRKSNCLALRLAGKLRKKVARSPDRLLTAVELAIAGNIIDFGVKNNVNVRHELKKILAQEHLSARKRSLFHYAQFRRSLRRAGNILYLADNAGETVFDRILIEEIRSQWPGARIEYAVKARPVINDALAEDAYACGIDKVARVVSNGADAPGTVLPLCSSEFRQKFRRADMVISKGQGNFESLSNEKRLVFFLFMVKCPVVARETGCRMGDIVLLSNEQGKEARR